MFYIIYPITILVHLVSFRIMSPFKIKWPFTKFPDNPQPTSFPALKAWLNGKYIEETMEDMDSDWSCYRH